MTITFEGRAPHPRYAFIGMDGEHNAETLILEGLPEHEGKTVVLNIILPNGTADALAVTDNLWTLSGMYEDRDGDGLPVFLMEYKRLKNDFTWETMKMRAASEDGSYIARIVT